MTPTDTQIQLRLERRFDASPEHVFDAWTNPEVLQQWWAAGPNWDTPLAEVDLPRLRALLTSSFGRPPRDEFFQLVARAAPRIYLEEAYRAAAILFDTPATSSTASLGSYLSKFAVDREAQGEGMGRDLWQAIAREFPRMFSGGRYPPNTLLVIDRLVHEQYLIEVQTVAAL